MESVEPAVTTSNRNTIANNLINFKHKLHIDRVRYKEKPSKAQRKIISRRIINYTVETTVEDLAKSASRGQTWTCAFLEGNRDNGCWISQSIFALDFDDGIPYEVFLKRLQDRGLDCTFAYTSFSSTPNFPKYRFVWQLDHIVTDINEQNQIMFALKTILPEHDSSAVAPCQMFFGGTELIYENYNYCLDLPQLFLELCGFVVADSKPQNISRDLNRLNRKTDNLIGMKNGNVYKNKYKEGQISSIQQHLLKVDWKNLSKEIRVLEDLLSGKWLDYPTCFGLVSNLIHLNGGVSRYKKSLDKMVELNKEKPEFQNALQEQPDFLNKLYNLPSVIKWYEHHYDYHPKRLENFSPYPEDWIYSNLLHAARKSERVRVKEYATIPLGEAVQKFDDAFDDALHSHDTNVHIFKVSTGLGKTKKLEDLDGVLIALPNHDLKDQIVERMKVSLKVTPNLPKDLPIMIRETIDYYFSIGAIDEANRFIAQEAKFNEDLAEYLKQLKSAYASSETVLTTHSKALFIDFNNLKTLIFDEDPLLSLLSIGNIPISDLINLKGRLIDETDKSAIDGYLEPLISAEKNRSLKTKVIDIKSLQAVEDEVLGNSYKYEGNVLAFLNSDWYVADPYEPSKVHFIKINFLPADRKVIILSATADERIYRHLLGDRLRFHDIAVAISVAVSTERNWAL